MTQASDFFTAQITLPTMPEVASKLLRSFGDDHLNLATLSSIIAKDPALSAKVLRLANSARFSPSRSISTIQDAAANLGLDTLRNLSMAACVAGAFPDMPMLPRQAFWLHSLSCAAYAQAMARALNIQDDSAYLCGLMLRSGEIIMALNQPGAVGEAEAKVNQPGSRFSHEKSKFGCTHAEVTAELADRWRFPVEMQKAFLSASEPMEAKPFSRLAAALHLAEILADASALGVDPTDALISEAGPLLAHLGVDAEHLRPKIAALSDPASDADMLMHP